MLITVTRIVSDDDSTVSTISIDGKFVCFGLEDEFREKKVVSKTRIPAGRYKVGIRKHGGFHKKYQKRFKNIHRGMLEILNVPNFTDILIHVGNTDQDTKGCLLVGTGAVARPGDMSIQSSVEAYRRFYPMVVKHAEDNDLEILISDADR